MGARVDSGLSTLPETRRLAGGTTALVKGLDLFVVVWAGGGKSTLLRAAVLAAKALLAMNPNARIGGILCVSTKTLADEQVRMSDGLMDFDSITHLS